MNGIDSVKKAFYLGSHMAWASVLKANISDYCPESAVTEAAPTKATLTGVALTKEACRSE